MTSASPKPQFKLGAILRIGVGLALVGYLVRRGTIDPRALGDLLASWPLTLGAFALMNLALVSISLRLSLLLRAQGFAISLGAAVRLTLIGLFFNACLPGATGGDVVRIYYASAGQEGRRTELVTIMLLDRVVGLVVLLLFPLLVAPLFLDMVRASRTIQVLLTGAALLVAGIFLTSVLALAVRSNRWGSVRGVLDRLPGGQYALRALRTVRAYRSSVGYLLGAMSVSALAHAASIAALLLLAKALGTFAWEMSLLIPLGFLANTLPLTPGGLGVGEAAFDALFALAGLEGGAEILLGWRLLSLLLGLVGLGLYMQGRRQFVDYQGNADPTDVSS